MGVVMSRRGFLFSSLSFVASWLSSAEGYHDGMIWIILASVMVYGVGITIVYFGIKKDGCVFGLHT